MIGKTTKWPRALIPMMLGLGLALGLLWFMMPVSATGAQSVIGDRIGPEVDGAKITGTHPGNWAVHPSPYVSADRYIRLEKNEDYYDAASVVITEVTSLFIDQDEAWTRYQGGELDTIAPPDSALDAIKASPIYSPHLNICASGVAQVYGFSNDVAPFDDPLVRAAFASAIDRPRVISEALSGDELPALTFTPPGHFGHVDGYTAGIGRPFSPTLAQDLLDASGYTEVPTITLVYNTSTQHQAVAEAARQVWIDTLGITVTLEGMDFSDMTDLLQNGSAAERPGIFRWGWGSDYPDAHNWLRDAFTWLGIYTRYENPAYDALVGAAAAETDPATRLTLYEQAEAMLVMTDTAIAPLDYYVNRRLARPDLVRTYRPLSGQHLDEWGFSGDVRLLEIAWGQPTTLDPALATDLASSEYVEQLFLGLTDFDSDTGEVLPELATTWDASDDATVYTFTLRTDALWTDSNPVTAQDVEYGVLRSLDPDTNSGSAYLLYIIENAEEFNRGDITDPNLVGVEALDATHIRFTLKSPAAYFPVIAGLSPARPQPQSAIQAHGSAWTDPANIVSNGPYTLVHWDQSPYLRIEKWSEDDPLANDSYAFTIRYRNDGGAAAENSVITDTMLGGMTYISDTSGFPHTGSGAGPIVWDLGTLAAHSDSQFDIHVQITAASGQEVTNRVQIATSDTNDLGQSWEKESSWSKRVQGPWMFVNYDSDLAGGVYALGHSFWITATDSVGTPKAWATATTEPSGGGHDGNWKNGFTVAGGDWSPSAPDIQPGDWVQYRSDNGYSNSVRVGTIAGSINQVADTASGTIEVPWLASQTIEVVAGGWGFPGFEADLVDLDATGKGEYFVNFSPTDLQADTHIGVTYVEPDADRVYSGIQALSQLYLPLVLRGT